MMVYIPKYNCIMKLKKIFKNYLLIGVHFHNATTLSRCCNCKKRSQRTRFNGSLPMKFYACK